MLIVIITQKYQNIAHQSNIKQYVKVISEMQRDGAEFYWKPKWHLIRI